MSSFHLFEKRISQSSFATMIHIHHFYLEVLPFEIPFVGDYPSECLIIVTSSNVDLLKKYNNMYPNCSMLLFVVENVGADIYPFLCVLEYLRQENIDYSMALKIHTKKKTELLKKWTTFLYDYERIRAVYSLYPNIGMMGSEILFMSSKDGRNFNHVLELLSTLCESIPDDLTKALSLSQCVAHYKKKFDINFVHRRHSRQMTLNSFMMIQKRKLLGWCASCPQFIHGTMFWVRGVILHRLAERLESFHFQALQDTPFTSGKDGQLPHAWERVFGLWTQLQGYSLFDQLDWQQQIHHLDTSFYKSFYSDVKEYQPNAEHHWKHHGRLQSRVCNSLHLEYKRNQSRTLLYKQLHNTPGEILTENPPLINILIRTSNRPTLFRSCLSSVLCQQYSSLRIHVSVDDDRSLLYLQEQDYSHHLTLVPVNPNRTIPFFYNLYCNDLLDQVKDGWILFLDDDEEFCDSQALWKMTNHLQKHSKETIWCWKFMRPDQLVFPSDLQDIKKGQIDTSSFCFHYSVWCNAGKIQWEARHSGDFHFLRNLLAKQKHEKISCLDLILTRPIQDDRIGNFGQSCL